MHNWGDPDVDWEGINDAAAYIGEGLRKWGRVDVRSWKEKYGTVRVYCSIGLCSIQQLHRPGYCFNQWPKWLWHLEFTWWFKLPRMALNLFFLPYNKWLYRRYYRRAVERWPHLREEILSCADYDEFLEGI